MPADGRPCREVTGQFEGTPTGQTCSRWAPQRVMLATDCRSSRTLKTRDRRHRSCQHHVTVAPGKPLLTVECELVSVERTRKSGSHRNNNCSTEASRVVMDAKMRGRKSEEEQYECVCVCAHAWRAASEDVRTQGQAHEV